MKLLLQLGLRNLVRQKKRNLILGIALAFGMMTLFLSSSFSEGLVDSIMNRHLVNFLGHVFVSTTEYAGFSVIRDREEMEARLHKILRPEIERISDLVRVHATAVGRGLSDSVTFEGLETTNKEAFEAYIARTKIAKGNAYDVTNTNAFPIPIIMSEDKARDINVDVGSVVKTRFLTIDRQVQTARFVVVALKKEATTLVNTAVKVDQGVLRELLHFRPHESSTLRVKFKDVSEQRPIIKEADRLYAALRPRAVVIPGIASNEGNAYDVAFSSFFEATNMTKYITLQRGDEESATNEEACVISHAFADAHALTLGSVLPITYASKFEGNVTIPLSVRGIYDDSGGWTNLVFLARDTLYRYFRQSPPPMLIAPETRYGIATNSALFSALAKEWVRLPRARTFSETVRKYAEEESMRYPIALDIGTVYESASMVVELERALSIVTFVFIVVLFFIILVGVVNTLRMAVRERIQEIGTTRAIGMRRWQVQLVFIFEAGFLGLIAGVVGVIMGAVAMVAISGIPVEVDNVINIILVNGHLHFVPKASLIIRNFLVIEAIVLLTAFFPARDAAKLRVADALRHFE